MSTAIIYASKTGNTKKIAESLSQKINIDCYELNNDNCNNINIEKYDTIILGSGVYAGKLHKNLINFINNINCSDKKNFSFIITWFGRGNSDKTAFDQGKNILTQKNHIVNNDYFKCFGQGFGFIKKGHPNDKDIDNALKWIKDVVK
jgi:flavodoxin